MEEFPGLSFAPGLALQAEVKAKFGAAISHGVVDRLSFALVASFGRCKFKLSIASVGVLLQAALGGVAPHFAVSQLGDRVFKFWVSSKSVGIFAARLRSFSCPSFVVFFHLWGDGGPNWRRELSLFLLEEEASWKAAPSRPRPAARSFVEVLKAPPPLSGANTVPVGFWPRPAARVAPLRRPSALVSSRAPPASRTFSPRRSSGSGGSDRRRPPPPVFSNSLQSRRSVFDRLGRSERAGPQPSHQSRRCTRCLSLSHWRPACRGPIRCRECGGRGHIAAACPVSKGFLQRQDLLISDEERAANIGTGGGPAISGPAFSDLGRAPKKTRLTWAAKGKAVSCQAEDVINCARPSLGGEGFIVMTAQHVSSPVRGPVEASRPISGPTRDGVSQGLNAADGATKKPLNSTPASAPSSSSAPRLSSTTVNPTENPLPLVGEEALVAESFSQATAEGMAFQRTDPMPFVPQGMEYEEVPDRVFMVRTVAPMHPPPRNEDLAIVSIDPLPGNAMLFANVRGVISDFLRLVKGMPVEDIQPSSLGQALVQLTHPYHRDVLVTESPHVFGDVLITFTRHNQGRNWRRSEFNQECWLLILGFPNDYWSERLIHSAVGTFARISLIVANPKYKTRLLLKVRIKEARQVPQFIVLGDPDTPLDESWTAQVEILQLNHPGEAPPPEEQIPVNVDPELGVPFDFFGLGQPLLPVQEEEDQDDSQGEQNQAQMGGNLAGWDAWPPGGEQVNAEQEVPVQNASEQIDVPNPAQMLPDLNVPLDDLDLDPVLINPIPLGAPQVYPGQVEQIQYLLQEEGEVFVQNQEAQGSGAIAGVPSANALGVDHLFPLPNLGSADFWFDEEIPDNQVMDHLSDSDLQSDAHFSLPSPDSERTISDPLHPSTDLVQQQDPHEFEQQLSAPAELDKQMIHQTTDQMQNSSGELNRELAPLLPAQHLHQLPEEADFIESIIAQQNASMQAHHKAHSSNFQTQLGCFQDGPEGNADWAQHSQEEISRLMNKFFPAGKASSLVVTIPSDWAYFFSNMLLSPASYSWAKLFLSSRAVQCLHMDESNTLQLSVPLTCPESAPVCSSDLTKKDGSNGEGCSKLVPPKKRQAKRNLAIVESEVRRSPRLTGITKGFKFSICSALSCMACKSVPPIVGKKTLKKLAVDFCGIKESEVDSKILQPKRRKLQPVSRLKKKNGK